MSIARCAQNFCQKFWVPDKSTVASFVGNVLSTFQEHLMPSVRLKSGEEIFPENSLKHLNSIRRRPFEFNAKLDCWSLDRDIVPFSPWRGPTTEVHKIIRVHTSGVRRRLAYRSLESLNPPPTHPSQPVQSVCDVKSRQKKCSALISEKTLYFKLPLIEIFCIR